MEIKAERLILRPFEEKDAKDIYEYLHEPQVNCFMSMKLDTMEDAIQEIKKRKQEFQSDYLAIVLKSENKVIGEMFSSVEGVDPEDEVEDTFTQKIIMSPARILRINLVCEKRVCFGNLSLL